MGMNCDDEKMVVISSTSTTKEWPQNNNHMISNDHHQKPMINSSTTKTMASSTTMDQRPSQDHHQQQQPQQALKCPRCDSSNTKFCYYNNYSLSQPRHFCKACKRYWTRGGTLRNVPVGGGCRKNKRLKRPSMPATASSALDTIAIHTSSSSPNLSHPSSTSTTTNSHVDLLSGVSNHHHHSHIGSLFYNHHDMSLPFSRYDHLGQSQLSSLGLGFSSNNNGDSTTTDDSNYQNGLAGSNSVLSSYSSIFGTAMASSSPTIASLLASKFASNNVGLKDHGSGGARGLSSFHALAPFEELNIGGLSGGHESGLISVNSGSNKQVSLELDGRGRSSALGWINGGNSATSCSDHQNQTDQIGLSSTISSDPSLYWTNPTAVGGGNWLDPTVNIGSNSVPSLI